MCLTHWGQVMHICVNKLAIIGSDNGLSPGQRQFIIWTSAGILLIRTIGINFSEILIEIHIFSYKKMHLKASSGKWLPFCLGLNVIKVCRICNDRYIRIWMRVKWNGSSFNGKIVQFIYVCLSRMWAASKLLLDTLIIKYSIYWWSSLSHSLLLKVES